MFSLIHGENSNHRYVVLRYIILLYSVTCTLFIKDIARHTAHTIVSWPNPVYVYIYMVPFRLFRETPYIYPPFANAGRCLGARRSQTISQEHADLLTHTMRYYHQTKLDGQRRVDGILSGLLVSDVAFNNFPHHVYLTSLFILHMWHMMYVH